VTSLVRNALSCTRAVVDVIGCGETADTAEVSVLKAIVRRVALLAFVALAVTAASTVPAASAATVSAPSLLGNLTVASTHQSGYSRDFFNMWVDADGNGCDTRREVLISEARVRPHVMSGCGLSGGRWWSAYDNLFITNASSLDIDHFVPLAEAWRSGAFRWSAGTREAFANDLGYSLSLIAVTAHTNRSKSDADPARWLPPFNAYRCTYVATWVAIKWRWRLTIDPLEKAALILGLTGCGAAAKVLQPTRAAITKTPVVSVASGGSTAAAGNNSGVDPRYPYCTNAIAAGLGPYYRGQDPEYAWYRDGDSDGIVCER
jgi:Excalibur calcium-binding domain/Protein of unknown function (DUF1524)